MIKPRQRPHPQAPWTLELHSEWFETRTKICEHRREWIEQNICDANFYHLTVMRHNCKWYDGEVEWIVEQPECSLGTALYIYAIHCSDDDGLDYFFDEVVNPYHRRPFTMIKGIARRMREGFYPDLGFQLLGDRPRQYKHGLHLLIEYLERVANDHLFFIPEAALKADLSTPAVNYFDYEYDEDGLFCTSYDAWYWQKYGSFVVSHLSGR